jgi:hypothetical protein
MDSVQGSLRRMLSHSVPRPGPEPDPATLAAFDQLLSEATLAGPDAPLDYRLAAPKWQFLCHAADHGGYVLHGSGTGDIAEFEPRQSNDIEEFGNRRAVYAASDGLWAMYFAIIDRDRYVTSLYNGCCRLGPAPDGPFGEPRYFVSVNEDALDHVPWRAGTVYLLPSDGFAEQPPMQLGDEWVRTQQVARATPVRPAARLSVEPADFPLLASIRGHDMSGRVTR